MKKLYFPALLGLIALASCKGGGADTSKYVGSWQATSFETPTEDSLTNVQLETQLKQIETWTEIPPEMKEMKIPTLDSAKKFATSFLNDQKAQMEPNREEFIKSFKMELGADGIAYRMASEVKDTAMWYTAQTKDGKTLIILDPFVDSKDNVPFQAALTAFEVIHSSGDSLRLKLRQPKELITNFSFQKSK